MNTNNLVNMSEAAAIAQSEGHIAAILLFGSRARRDEKRGSDTDLLLIVPDGEPRHVSWDNFSLFLYSWHKLLKDAADGDLFVCHLVQEAKPVFDPADKLRELKASFRLRANYTRLIGHAADFGWFLDRFGRELNSGVVARRMMWCVRTLLIARSAELGRPTFAPKDLASFSTSSVASELLAARHQRRADAALRTRFRRFLAQECPPSDWHFKASSEEFARRFVDTENKVALESIKRSEEFGFYR
jgi:predicted nucleotidyltransferase